MSRERSETPFKRPASDRLLSLDVYRGFIMMLLVSGGLGLNRTARSFPDSAIWRFLGHHFEHIAWSGFAFWDLIQPAFIFMAGVSIPYSYASRKAQGESDTTIMRHTITRAILLILLGVFLSSNSVKSPDHTNWIFVNVLSQIGLGYVFASLLRGKPRSIQVAAVAGLLFADWLLFALYPAPGPGFDYQAVAVPDTIEKLGGFFGHWNKSANAAAAFDRWFLNLLPRSQPYVASDGWQTLNFIPQIGTMAIGLMSGQLLRGPGEPKAKLARLAGAAVVCILLGVGLGHTVCPLVRRVETPSWILLSSGSALVMLAVFYGIIEVRGHRTWAQPLAVLGMNSIALYCMGQLGVTEWIRRTVGIHLGRWMYQGPYGSIGYALTGLAGAWVICFWMYRRRIFLRI